MRKRLVILSLLLAGALVPVPGQAANNPAGSSQNVQKQGEKSQTYGQPAATTIPQSSAGPTQANAENPSSENTGNSVTVRKLPTVSIGKDWADWSYWGFGGILVVVGTLQVWFLHGTLKAIQTQAGHMERQTKALEDSVAAAKKSADAALETVQVMIDSERPWLVAHFKGENELCLLENGSMRLKWEVKNVGKSPARLIEAGARLILDTIEPGWTNSSDFGHVDSLDGRILVPGDSVSFYVFWSKIENGILRTATGKRREDFNDLVVGYGFVKYQSTVGEGEDLIARFCECASIDAGVISGPFDIWEFAGEEYLRCT